MKGLLHFLFAVLPVASGDLDRVREIYNRTEYRQALEALGKSPEKTSAQAQLLEGQCWYQLGEFKRAADSFERAAAAQPGNSVFQNWLGRAYGRRAETSNPLAAPGHAVKARIAFERAVELDPSNLEAMDDLFSYYIEAPPFLGGGVDKAEALAERIKSRDMANYHGALARLAERRRQPDIAERQLRRAVEIAPKSVARLVDLAKYLARHGKQSESEQLFAKARRTEPASRQVLYAQAEVLIETKWNLSEARRLLESYLSGPLTPDDPPREEALRLLGKTR